MVPKELRIVEFLISGFYGFGGYGSTYCTYSSLNELLLELVTRGLTSHWVYWVARGFRHNWPFTHTQIQSQCRNRVVALLHYGDPPFDVFRNQAALEYAFLRGLIHLTSTVTHIKQ